MQTNGILSKGTSHKEPRTTPDLGHKHIESYWDVPETSPNERRRRATQYEEWAKQLRADRKVLTPRPNSNINLDKGPRDWDLSQKKAVASRLEKWAEQLRKSAIDIIKKGQPGEWPRMLAPQELTLN